VLWFLRSPALEDALALLVHDHYEVRPAEIAGLAQFGSEALSLIDGFFRIRKALAEFIGKEYRTVQDMEKILRHGDLQSATRKQVAAGDMF
jgi:hypothetical protein